LRRQPRRLVVWRSRTGSPAPRGLRGAALLRLSAAQLGRLARTPWHEFPSGECTGRVKLAQNQPAARLAVALVSGDLCHAG
jgi:hypothetical protein